MERARIVAIGQPLPITQRFSQDVPHNEKTAVSE
jgi:hypothetical protein